MANDMTQDTNVPKVEEKDSALYNFFWGTPEYRKSIQEQHKATAAAAQVQQSQASIQQQQLELVTQELNNMKQTQNKSKVWGATLSAVENGDITVANQLINDPALKPAFQNLGITSVEQLNIHDPKHIQAYEAAGIPKDVLNFLKSNISYNRDISAGITPYKNMDYVDTYGNLDRGESGYLNPEELNKFVQSFGVAYPLYRDKEGNLKAGQLQDLIGATGAVVSEYNAANRNKVFDFIANVNNSFKGIAASATQAAADKAEGENQKVALENNLTKQIIAEITSDKPDQTKIDRLKAALLAAQGKSVGNTAGSPGELQKLVDTYKAQGYSDAEALKLAEEAYNTRYGPRPSSLTAKMAAVEEVIPGGGKKVAEKEIYTPVQQENEYINNLANKLDAIVSPENLSKVSRNIKDPRYTMSQQKIRELETALKFNVTDTLAFKISDLAGFKDFANKLSTLTGKDTGPIDNLVNTIMPYIDSKYAKDPAAIAFQQSTIQIGNAMFGATYTPGEMAKYVSGMSSLYQNDKQIKAATKVYLENLIAQAKGLRIKFPDDRIFNWYMQPRIDDLQEALTKLDTSKGAGGKPKDTQVMRPSQNAELAVGSPYNGKVIKQIITSKDGRKGIVYADGSTEVVK